MVCQCPASGTGSAERDFGPIADVDIWRLHAAVDQATHATGPIEQRRALQQVIDTYTDELAKNWPWPWLDTDREAIRRHVLDAHTTLANPATAPAP